MFPNVDLTIHLYRQPVPGAVGLDTTVVFGPTGQGLTTTILHDEQGPVDTPLKSSPSDRGTCPAGQRAAPPPVG